MREASRGTAAIEFLKGLQGIKECFFARVKYQNVDLGDVIVDTDQISEEVSEAKEWKLVDLSRPIEGDCEIEMVNFEQSQSSFWHSSAHILGSAIENTF